MRTADLELGFARLSATLGPCAHRDAVPVESILGETVAWLCPQCDTQLPADWTTASPKETRFPWQREWNWEWACTCGESGCGSSSSQDQARAESAAGVASHSDVGHSWENAWWSHGSHYELRAPIPRDLGYGHGRSRVVSSRL